MNLQLSQACRSMNLAALRLAAFLVPRRQRAEWLKEWRSELWHVRELCIGEHEVTWQREQEVAAFCLGAFPDALCLREHNPIGKTPPGDHLASATQCLLFLVALATACFCAALFLPGARAVVQPSPYRDPRSLMLISRPAYTGAFLPTIRADQFRLWKDRKQHLFDGFAFYQPLVKTVTLAPHRRAELSVARSSPNLFDLLGLPIRFAPLQRDLHSTLPMLVLSENVWQKYFGADPGISGRIIRIGLRNVQIIGIMPAQQWNLPGSIDAWLLEPGEDATAIPSNAKGFVIAHLEPSLEQARFADHWAMSAPTPSEQTAGFTCDSVYSRAREPFGIFVFTVLLAFLALPATTSLPLGEYPATPHRLSWSTRLGRWFFLVAKITLILPTIYFGSLDLAHLTASIDPLSSQYIQIASSFCGCLFALRWTLRDQRQRCPVCLGKLTNPARVGQPSRNFLSWNGTELICIGGHGLLHVPEIPTSWFSTQRWLYLDPSWGVLFPDASLASPGIS